MNNASTPTGTRRIEGAVSHAIASSTGPILHLRARRYGLDWLTATPPVLELYYEPGDPHSALCAQLLLRLQQRLRTRLQVHVVGPPEPVLYPEHEKQRSFALQDAIRIAPCHGLTFPEDARLPTPAARRAAAARLVSAQSVEDFVARDQALQPWLWQDATAVPAVDNTGVDAALATASRRRKKQGHYLPGMWQFNGEWFWGVDRLLHLERRLRAMNLLEGDEPICSFDASRARLPVANASHTLEFFFSFRSPYSYLAAVQVRQMLPQLGVPLQIRPVLPMVMRGLKVPSAKRFYIVRDVYREAQMLGIPFGHIADPVGAGAKRCLSAFPLADTVDQQSTFIATAAAAIWSEAVDVSRDGGLQSVCERTGMDWNPVKQALAGDARLDYAEHNRQALFDAGLWGVPSFKLGDFASWGRDRLWMIQEILRRQGLLAVQ